MKRFIYILFIAFLSQAGQACSLKAYEYCKFATEKKGRLIESRKVHCHHDNEIPKFIRKYRAKEVETFLYPVLQLSFNDFYHYSEFLLLPAEITASHFLYCSKYKRGPPSA